MDNDHDILIEVKTILKGVVDDFRAYRKSSHDEMIAMDIRVSRLEKGYWMTIGIISFIQFIALIVTRKFF